MRDQQRADASTMEVTQWYPTNRNPPRWLKSRTKKTPEKYEFKNQWGDTSLSLDRSFFFEE
jgi:hypothetical protein